MTRDGRYVFYMTENNAETLLVVENRRTETWEASLLAVDISDEEAVEIAKSFLAGKEETFEEENGEPWEKDKETLLPESAQFFGFRELDI